VLVEYSPKRFAAGQPPHSNAVLRTAVTGFEQERRTAMADSKKRLKIWYEPRGSISR
jgi:hypothetical protein